MSLPKNLQDQRVAAVGLGRAHRALVPRLLGEGAEVRAYDRLDALSDVALELGIDGAFGRGYLDALIKYAPDIAFLTPGMPKHLPEFQLIEERGAWLSAEAAYFLSRRRRPCVGVTGSAGKTTTTSLVGEMLLASGLRPSVCGNIGRPFATALDDADEAGIYVGEFSSFQLSLCDESPEIAAILNIRPNHLDVHRDFEDYRDAKWRIAGWQEADGTLVVPEDLRSETPSHTRAQVLSFAAAGGTDASVEDGWLKVHGTRLLPIEGLRLRGAHNRENALAAALLALSAGAQPEAVSNVLAHFSGVTHRQEILAERGGVTFVNDSIATAPDRTLAAFETFDGPILWLGGGYDKHLDYRPLLEVAGRMRVAFLFGPVGEILLPLLRAEGVRCAVYGSFDAAVEAALSEARKGDTVLMSPAAASYDEFSDFAERGERFRTLLMRSIGSVPGT